MKIAIAGYGIEGKVNYEYFVSKGNVTIVDERETVDDLPKGASVLLGRDAFSKLQSFDLVVRSPGVALRKIKTGGKVWSATNEFFLRCPALIIGVTGSKGKGTTAGLIANIIQQSGRTVHLVGNIGKPALSVLGGILPEDIVVYEMSSFQLWDIERSPQIAVVLMIEPDHLDVHESFDEYLGAKARIIKYQTDENMVVYNNLNEFSRLIGEKAKSQKRPYQSNDTAHVHENKFWFGAKELCDVNVMSLPGAHNLDNACAAIDVAWFFTQDRDTIRRGIETFEGLPHRLKLARVFEDVKYYDDSIATTPGSAIAAIKAFTAPKVMIMGGSGKGASFEKIAEVARSGNVKIVLLIGEEAEKINVSLKTAGVKTIKLGERVTMSDVVNVARLQATAGDVVILSPACASFDMFKNYKERGDQFIKAVNKLA